MLILETIARIRRAFFVRGKSVAAHEADSGKRKALAALIHVAQIEVRIADFDRKVKELENAIQAEEERTGIHDPAHVAYSVVAKGKIERRDNLMRGIAALKLQLADAKAAVDRPRPSWREHRARGPSLPAQLAGASGARAVAPGTERASPWRGPVCAGERKAPGSGAPPWANSRC